jgi:hypothetical protein
MPPQSLPAEQLGKLFRRRKCWMLADLAHALDYALISVRRLLKRIGYFRSYTHNGKWYTLHDSPQFNREGIWHHKDIGFSRHGSLTATIAYLVERSPAGLSAQDLTQKLQHPCHAVLTHLHNDQVLDRVKVGGQFRYLATEELINRRQREEAAITPLATQRFAGLLPRWRWLYPASRPARGPGSHTRFGRSTGRRVRFDCPLDSRW